MAQIPFANRDCIIIGAGIAGASAAHGLVSRGASVLLIEARDRLGGRGYRRNFTGTQDPLEFGGGWITPWHSTMRELCSRYGIGLSPRAPFSERRWYRDGALHLDGPVADFERARHEEALARVAADSIALKLGHEFDEKDRPIAEVTFNEYVARLDAPGATRGLLSAWWTVSGSGDKSIVPMAALLSSCAYRNGYVDAMAEVWSHTLEGGVQALVEAILSTPGVDPMLGVAVTGVQEDASGVTVMLADGRLRRARAALVATGMNPMRSVSFADPLSAPQQAAIAEGHPGRAVKVWVKARNLEVGILATGGSGIEWMFSSHKESDGTTMVVGFGVAADGWQPRFPGDARAALARFFPEAEFVAADFHDWISDPWALGTWVTERKGAAERHIPAFWAPRGRIAFASSDFAPRDAGWFEGAAVSGAQAADAVMKMLA